MVSVIAHELSEAVSDPELDAWYEAQPYGGGQGRQRLPDPDLARLQRHPSPDGHRGDPDAEHRSWPHADGESADVGQLEPGLGQHFVQFGRLRLGEQHALG